MSGAVKHFAAKFASLRVHGPDHRGIVAACSSILDKYGHAIVKSEQFTDPLEEYFYQRSLFKPAVEKIGNQEPLMHVEQKMALEDDILQFKQRFGLEMACINWRERRKRVAVFVSKYDHCLVSNLLSPSGFIHRFL